MDTRNADTLDEEGRDPDLAKAEVAMQRAAGRARERAQRLGNAVVVMEDGRIVEEWPESSPEEGPTRAKAPER